MAPITLTRREAIASTVAASALLRANRPSSLPNILFIMADDLGWADLSSYGNRDFETPNIDRLAREGIRMTDAYANSCVCSPTRMALITGRYQYRLAGGLEEPIKERGRGLEGLPPSHPTIASLLKARGYRTALVGKWHLGHPPAFGPLKSGYDEFFGIGSGGADYFTHKDSDGNDDLYLQDKLVERSGYLTDLLTDHAAGFVQRQADAPVAAPFFLSLHYTAPHWPWESEQDEAIAAGIKNMFHIDGGSLATYAAMIASMDKGIGRILDMLDREGMARDTIVIFTSDNGGERFSKMWPLMGEKGDLLEGGIRVPALIRYPGRIAPGSESGQVAISMDWLPTLLAMAGISPDPSFPPDGIDLSSPLAGGADIPRRLFWRFKGRSQAAVRDGQLKYLKRGTHEFLFDVAADPRERANLATIRKADFDRLKAAYEAWNGTMLKDDKVKPYQLPEEWFAK